MIKILVMLAKMANPGIFKRNISWNKGYGVVLCVHDVNNKILLRESNDIVDVVM